MRTGAQEQPGRWSFFRASSSAFFCLLLLIAACAPEAYPGDPLTDTVASLPMPEIVPLDGLLGQIGETRDAEDPDPELRQRGEDLRIRVADAPSPAAAQSAQKPVAGGAANNGSIVDRGADLRQRADAVRNAPPE